jgi:hypothetical protein
MSLDVLVRTVVHGRERVVRTLMCSTKWSDTEGWFTTPIQSPASSALPARADKVTRATTGNPERQFHLQLLVFNPGYGRNYISFFSLTRVSAGSFCVRMASRRDPAWV